MRKEKLSAAALFRGPSADGTPGPTVTLTWASAGSGSVVLKASQRPSCAWATRLPTTSCAFASSSDSSARSNVFPSDFTAIVLSTAVGSIRWLKWIKNGVSRRVGPSLGKDRSTAAVGVVKLKRTEFASFPPLADVVPAGMSTVYFVAAGKRPAANPVLAAGSKTSVLVPTQRHCPSGCGESLTGTSAFARSLSPVSATIGWLNVTLRLGATGTSPSGAYRSTSSTPVATSGAVAGTGAGGKLCLIVLPGRGAGSVCFGRLSSITSPAAPVSGGSRSSNCSVSAAGSGSAGAGGRTDALSSWALPADNRNCSPGVGCGVSAARGEGKSASGLVSGGRAAQATREPPNRLSATSAKTMPRSGVARVPDMGRLLLHHQTQLGANASNSSGLTHWAVAGCRGL